MSLAGTRITVHDMTLRDGMHPKRHQISLDQMRSIARGLDAAGVPLIEVTHGDGLGGASVNYGFPAHTDEAYLSAVIGELKQARVSALLLPGIGTVEHLRMAHELGVHTIRVATHCTEADVSEQHIGLARKLEMDTVGFLMMAHMSPPEQLVKQAKLMESYGANCIYITDSAGYMLPDDVTARIGLVRSALKPETELVFTGITILRWGWRIRLQLWPLGPIVSMPLLLGSGLALAIRRWKFLSLCASGWGLRRVLTFSVSRTWPRILWCRSWTRRSGLIAMR
jgi:4-hydroxy-2-oxovalerate aldolase